MLTNTGIETLSCACEKDKQPISKKKIKLNVNNLKFFIKITHLNKFSIKLYHDKMKKSNLLLIYSNDFKRYL